MKPQIKISLLVAITTLLFFCELSWAQNTGRYIVSIRRPVNNAVINSGGRVIHQYKAIPAIAIEIPNAALNGLLRNPNVVSITPDVEAWAVAPNASKTPPGLAKKPQPPSPDPEPTQTLPWGIDRIDADLVSIMGTGINVAIIDTGIDLDHPDLNPISGYDFVNRDSIADDDNGHGTHVAGIVAALDNNYGVVGVAPKASIYAIKVLNRRGSGYISSIIAGIDWCIDNNIDIINMSLGSYSNVPEFGAICDKAKNTYGILIVAAAGNDATSTPFYPASYKSVISVGATTINDQLAYFSNLGFEIAAPGYDIYSTYKGGIYKTLSGTSMASPHVAGTLALMLQAKKTSYAFELINGIRLIDAYRTVNP